MRLRKCHISLSYKIWVHASERNIKNPISQQQFLHSSHCAAAGHSKAISRHKPMRKKMKTATQRTVESGEILWLNFPVLKIKVRINLLIDENLQTQFEYLIIRRAGICSAFDFLLLSANSINYSHFLSQPDSRRLHSEKRNENEILNRQSLGYLSISIFIFSTVF